MKKFHLVTGGAGFIGSHIVEALLKEGKSVRVLDNFSTGKMQFLEPYKKDIHIIRGDIRRAGDCFKAAQNAAVVFHQAAEKSVPKSVLNPLLTHETDATGTLNVLEACKKNGVRRFILASSCAVYGIAKKYPIKEEAPLEPLSPYGAAKIAAEKYAFSYYAGGFLETVALRYFNVYGPFQDPESVYSAAVPGLISRLKRNERPIIYGTGRQSRDFVYVSDVARANLLAAEVPHANGGVFNIASGQDQSILRLCRDLSGLMGKEKLKPLFKERRPSDPNRASADISKAGAILGWKPLIDFYAGLKNTVEWFA